MKNLIKAKRNFWDDAGGFLGGLLGGSNESSEAQPITVNIPPQPAQDNTMMYVLIAGVAAMMFFMKGGKR